MDLELIKEYGLAVFILIGAAKGIQVLYTNMRSDKKESDANWAKVFDKHESNSKENQNLIVAAMKEQTETLRDVKLSLSNNNTKLDSANTDIGIVKMILEELKSRGVS